jgi:hypothetical protein
MSDSASVSRFWFIFSDSLINPRSNAGLLGGLREGIKRRKSMEAVPGGLLRGLAEAGPEEEEEDGEDGEEGEKGEPAPDPDPAVAAVATDALAAARRAAVGLGVEASDADVAAVEANMAERAEAAAATERGEKLRKLSAAVRAVSSVCRRPSCFRSESLLCGEFSGRLAVSSALGRVGHEQFEAGSLSQESFDGMRIRLLVALTPHPRTPAPPNPAPASVKDPGLLGVGFGAHQSTVDLITRTHMCHGTSARQTHHAYRGSDWYTGTAHPPRSARVPCGADAVGRGAAGREAGNVEEAGKGPRIWRRCGLPHRHRHRLSGGPSPPLYARVSPPSLESARRVVVVAARTLGAAHKPSHALALSTHAELGTLGAVQEERFRAMREKLLAEGGAT